MPRNATAHPDRRHVQRVAKVALALKGEAINRGFRITPDERVNEADAAELLDLQPATLKALRNGAQGPSFYNRGAGNGSRVSYRFDDLAAWLERGRNEQ